jgi:5-methylcytosine-specific restriction endonuclease McrA
VPFVFPPLFSHAEIRRRVKTRLGTTSRSTWAYALEVFDYRCAYCGLGDRPLQRDHVIPLSRGGLDHPANVVPACGPCNSAKGDQDWRYFMRERGYDVHWFFMRLMRLKRGP